MKEFMKYGQLYQLDDENRLWACLLKASSKGGSSKWTSASPFWENKELFCEENPLRDGIDAKFLAFYNLPLRVYKIQLNGIYAYGEYKEGFSGRTLLQINQSQVNTWSSIREQIVDQGNIGRWNYSPWNFWWNNYGESYPATPVFLGPVYTASRTILRSGILYDDK